MQAKWIAMFALLGSAVAVQQLSYQQPTQDPARAPTVLASDLDKVSYGIGVQVARNFEHQGMDVNLDLVAKGMQDVVAKRKLLLGEKELQATMRKYEEELRRQQARDRKIAAVDNKQAGDAYLAANAAKEGVVTLPNGLQYRIVVAGAGSKPSETDTVECRYSGRLINGIEFDSSDPDRPAVFKMKGTALIAGLVEALKRMPAGSKWELAIPPQLAYGERGSGQFIGPNATLLFELELVAVKVDETKEATR